MKSKNKAAETKTKSPPILKQSSAPTFWQKQQVILLLLAIIILVFANTIPNKYALDDEFYTNHGNKFTDQGISAIPKIFSTRTFTNTADGGGYSYRPIAVLSFALEHQFIKANPHVSHLINLLLYLLTAVLVFFLLKKLFANYSQWFVFFVCLLYFIHPLHTEVVANIKCRDELLAALGALGCVWFAWRFYETGKWYYALLYPLCYALGILSKHTVAPYLLIFPLVFYFFSTLNYKKIVLYTLPLFFAAMSVRLVEKLCLEKSSRHYQMLENALDSAKMNFVEKSATGFYVLCKYLFLHFIPQPLVYYYGYRYVPVAEWTYVLPIAGVLLYSLLFAIAVYQFRKKTVLSFGILFYLVSIAPYSNLIFPAPGMMAERFTYASTLGFSIAICAAIFAYFKINPSNFEWKGNSKKVGYIICSIAFLFGIRSMVRNANWKDKMTLYTHDMEYLGESAKANMMYGAMKLSIAQSERVSITRLMNQGRQNRDTVKQLYASFNSGILEAQSHFKKATEITPTYPIAWINLASTYYFQNNFKLALHYSSKGVELNPKSVEGTYNMGMAYNSLGKRDSATYFFNRTLKLDSSHFQSYDRLCAIKMAEKDTVSALNYLLTSAKYNPTNDIVLSSLSQFYVMQGDTVNGLKTTELAAQNNPKNKARLKNLAGFFQTRGDMGKANLYYNLLAEQEKLDEIK